MKKICYRPVYNRKKRLNAQGEALVQVEAYLGGKKSIFPRTSICDRSNGTREREWSRSIRMLTN